MRARLLLAVAASTLAGSLAPQPASAQHSVQCSPGYEAVCVAYHTAFGPLCALKIHC